MVASAPSPNEHPAVGLRLARVLTNTLLDNTRAGGVFGRFYTPPTKRDFVYSGQCFCFFHVADAPPSRLSAGLHLFTSTDPGLHNFSRYQPVLRP